MPGMGGGPVWVQITAEDGNWGLGNCSFGAPVAAIVEQVFAPLLTGRDCLATEFPQRPECGALLSVSVMLGPPPLPKAGIDLALWDLKGKLLGLPVYRLLGGPCRDHLSNSTPRATTSTGASNWGLAPFKVTNPVHYREGQEGLNRPRRQNRPKCARPSVRICELMLNAVMSYNVEYAVQVAERPQALSDALD